MISLRNLKIGKRLLWVFVVISFIGKEQ